MDRLGRYDEPDETSRPRQPPPPWWREHHTADIHISAPHRDNPAEPPDQSRQRWHHDHRTPADQQPAPFRPDIADKVPPVSADKPGANGRLDLHDGRTGIPLDSGHKTGLTDTLRQQYGQLPLGFTRQNQTHVEAHAVAYLRLHPETTNATLYINRQPCPGPRGCRDNLPAMLPETPPSPSTPQRMGRRLPRQPDQPTT
jgi:hypothetical protein